MWLREAKHIKVGQATCGQILAYGISVFPADVTSFTQILCGTCHRLFSMHNYFHQGLIYKVSQINCAPMVLLRRSHRFISIFTQLHSSGFNLEFETLFESI